MHVRTKTERVPPCVVFADIEGWTCFLQFAAALRRHGVVVTRVTTRSQTTRESVRKWMQRIVFHHVDETICLAAGGELDGLGSLVNRLGEGARALEAADRVAADLTALMPQASGGRPLWKTRDGLHEDLLYDKLAMTQFAQSLGVMVPATFARVDPADVAYPLMLKPKLGSGGQGIRMAIESGSHAQMVADMGVDGSAYFSQSFVDGERINFGGVANGGEITAGGCYWSWPNSADPLGPPALVATTDNPQLVEMCARLIAGLGYTGAFCMNFVAGTKGEFYLIDFNSRIFGSWLALQRDGVDIIGAYLAAHGITSSGSPAVRRARLHQANRTLSSAEAAVIATNPHRIDLMTVELLGPRWLLVAGAEVVQRAVRRGLTRLMGRTASASEQVAVGV